MQLHVLTGDLVHSTGLAPPQLDRIFEALGQLSEGVSAWPGGDPTGFARRGGDGWQMACPASLNALRLALIVQATVGATVDGARTRIAVATGPGTPNADLNAAHGAAFTASGRLLNTITDQCFMDHSEGGALRALYATADHIAQGWTQAQARAVAVKLAPGKIANREIADALGISRQAVDQALAAAGYPALKRALSALEHPTP